MPEKPGRNERQEMLEAGGESREAEQREFGCNCCWVSLFHRPRRPRQSLFLSGAHGPCYLAKVKALGQGHRCPGFNW